MADIFDRQRLTATQLRTVAQRRFGDAQCLCDSGKNARANGAMYLGGLAMECMLKARLIETHPDLRTAASPDQLPPEQRPLWSLCYQRHDLQALVERLPIIVRRIQAAEQHGGSRRIHTLRSICGRWTIFARYSPRQATIREAREFLHDVKDLRPWLA